MTPTAEDELTSPKLEALEERLWSNYDEFRAASEEWSREWQRAMVRRAKARRAQKDADTSREEIPA